MTRKTREEAARERRWAELPKSREEWDTVIAQRRQEQERAEQERKERMEKMSALQAWKRDGGDERSFERAWPELRDEQRRRRVMDADRQARAAQRARTGI